MENATKKTRISDLIPTHGNSFERYPRAFLPSNDDVKLTKTAKRMLAKIFTQSCISENPDATCASSIKNFMNDFKRARSTICENVARLRDNHYISQKKNYHDRSEYTVPGIDANASFIQIEDYFRTQEFPITKKLKTGEQETIFRRFDDDEVFALGIIATVCKNPKGDGIYRASVAQIAAEVGVCEKKMVKILDVLTGTPLVNCLDKYRHRSHHKELRFTIHHRLKRQMNRSHKLSKLPKAIVEQKAEEELKAKQIKEANERTDRERWYAARRAEAERPVREAEAILQKDEEYKALSKEKSKLEIESAKAEIFTPEKLPEIQQEQERVAVALEACMARLGVSPEQLVPAYQCLKCSDTGFLPNQRACDCHRPPGRRFFVKPRRRTE